MHFFLVLVFVELRATRNTVYPDKLPIKYIGFNFIAIDVVFISPMHSFEQ